ncbi:hypothetical protein [Abyssogena phaseoliformis symbiont]|uniref:hypothetical protein n=1 Tax=Abyssogena phaseoliformis symbiont TaxID=596095 RepID=UPI001916BAEE|nr:hypothetical protein [Abyssogena phaseoliformis symbiont]
MMIRLIKLTHGEYFEAVNLITIFIKSARISSVTADLLYTQIDSVDKTRSYYFNVGMQGIKNKIKIEFSAQRIGYANAFHNALLRNPGQSTFDEGSKEMKQILKKMARCSKPISTTMCKLAIRLLKQFLADGTSLAPKVNE